MFSTNFRLGFDPADFQAVLPKHLIHRMIPGEPVYALLEAWKRAARETMATRVWGPRQWFVVAAHRLAALGYPVSLRSKLLAGGFLLIRRKDHLHPRCSHPEIRTALARPVRTWVCEPRMTEPASSA